MIIIAIFEDTLTRQNTANIMDDTKTYSWGEMHCEGGVPMDPNSENAFSLTNALTKLCTY